MSGDNNTKTLSGLTLRGLTTRNRHKILYLMLALVLVLYVSSKYITKGDITSYGVLASRYEFPGLLTEMGLKTMVEIGVHGGQFADATLGKWNSFEHYYGIDVWKHQANYIDTTNAEDDQQDLLYKSTYDLLTSKFGKERITLIRNYSTMALGFFKDESIDFIYVDARHDYCGATEDIKNYFPKLKCGGIFAGHDYQFDSQQADNDWSLCANGTRIEGSVKKAVLDFAERNSVQQVFSTGEPSFCSWYFQKSC
jgi:hypothetical protein